MGRKALDWPEEEINELYRRFQGPTRLFDLEVILGKPSGEIVRVIVHCSRRDPVEPGRVWDPELVDYYVRRYVELSELKSAAKKREEGALATLAERGEELANVRGRVREFILVELEQKARDLEAWRKRLDERERQLNKRGRELEKKGESLTKRLRKKENDLEEERIERRAGEMAKAISKIQRTGYNITGLSLGPKRDYLVIKTRCDPYEKRATVSENFVKHIGGALQILGMEELDESFMVSVVLKYGKVTISTKKRDRTEDSRCFLRAYEQTLRREAKGRRV
jgi:hypothetical protein